ncbi:MAG: bifunctional precorrin-2 dehydrogenase/sirohydrochlorin ferrochelatase [Candidatus Binatia bacterium]
MEIRESAGEQMTYYPIFLDLTGRRCVVIGGGSIAERKVEGLLAAGAEITVVSPEMSEGLGLLLMHGSIKHVARKYQNGDLEGYAMAFVATDDEAITAAVFCEARCRGIWVNCADDPSHCDFILPAVIRRGELAIAVSSGGASPALARAVREELEKFLTDDFAQLVQTASEVRRELRQRSLQTTAEAWNRALTGDFRHLIQQGKTGEAKQLLLATLEGMSCE